jgi:hypothetical protein
MHRNEGFDIAAAKRMCDPKTVVKPGQLGWVCEHVDGKTVITKGEGGTRRKSDAVCE